MPKTASCPPAPSHGGSTFTTTTIPTRHARGERLQERFVHHPDLGETSANVFYRFHLRVTDSGGLTHSVSRDIQPRKSTVTLATNPAGLQLRLDGQPVYGAV